MEPDPAPPLKGARAAKPLIVLVGRNGQHKRALMWALAKAYEGQIVVVPTITNRCPEMDDEEGEFVHHADHIIDQIDRAEGFIESSCRDDTHRTFYGRTLRMILEVLRERIGIAVTSENGALSLRVSGIVCYVIKIVTIGDPTPGPPSLAPAGLRPSEEICCEASPEGLIDAISQLRPLVGRITAGIQTTRPPPGPAAPEEPFKPT